MDITIWDCDATRISDIERNLRSAMKKLSVEGHITIMSEPPLLNRMGVIHRVPLLEINGMYWSLHVEETIPEADIIDLLRALAHQQETIQHD